MNAQSLSKDLGDLEGCAKQYVLGKLSGEQLEQFELLLLEDARVQQLLEDIEGDLCEEYLFKHLPPDERKAFEDNYLQAESHLLRLETIRCMYADHLLKPIASKAEAEKSASEKPLNVGTFIKIAAGIAAGFVLTFLVYYLFIRGRAPLPEDAVLKNVNSNTQDQRQATTLDNKNIPGTQSGNSNQNPGAPSQQKPVRNNSHGAEDFVAIVELTSAPKMGDRGSETPTAPLTASTKKVELIVRLKATPFTSFISKIERADGTPIPSIMTKRTLHRESSVIVAQVNVSHLDEGFYTLSLSGIRQDGTPEFINAYPFRVERR